MKASNAAILYTLLGIISAILSWYLGLYINDINVTYLVLYLWPVLFFCVFWYEYDEVWDIVAVSFLPLLGLLVFVIPFMECYDMIYNPKIKPKLLIYLPFVLLLTVFFI